MIITKTYLARRSAVQAKLLINFDWLKKLGITPTVAQPILQRLGFKWESAQPKLIDIAYSCLGAIYCRGSRLHNAPSQFDCSSFVRYCYSQIGLWIPRRSIQQFNYGLLAPKDLAVGDLLFSRGRIPYWDISTGPHIGHVGLYVGNDCFIHAAHKSSGVAKSTVRDFVTKKNYVGAVRLIPKLNNCVTLYIPPRWQDAESVDDIKWIIRIHS